MITQVQKIALFRKVVGGMSLPAAARAVDVTANQARNAIAKMCRSAQLANDIKQMRSGPDPYLRWLSALEQSPGNELRPELQRRLIGALRLRSHSELTPKHLSNLTVSQLLAAGLTQVALAEIHEWLAHHGFALKRGPIKAKDDMRAISRAISLLEAYGFNVDEAKRQLQHVQSDD
jgi:hypothetical protein